MEYYPEVLQDDGLVLNDVAESPLYGPGDNNEDEMSMLMGVGLVLLPTSLIFLLSYLSGKPERLWIKNRNEFPDNSQNTRESDGKFNRLLKSKTEDFYNQNPKQRPDFLNEKLKKN